MLSILAEKTEAAAALCQASWASPEGHAAPPPQLVYDKCMQQVEKRLYGQGNRQEGATSCPEERGQGRMGRGQGLAYWRSHSHPQLSNAYFCSVLRLIWATVMLTLQVFFSPPEEGERGPAGREWGATWKPARYTVYYPLPIPMSLLLTS